ncbi:MAG TPA: hypothetical protein VLK25_05805 [Allosphingosinicella sp.]|nr:hypothetical protein [Allosphingosinicella sp.]
MTRTFALLSLLMLGACARSEEARMDSNDANQVGPRVETVRPDSDDDEVALGAWRDGLQDEQRVLEFGPTGAPPLFSLRCDARRGVLLQRHGLAPSGDLPVMRVSVGNEARQLAVTGTSGPNPMLRAALSGSDSLLAALGRATAPFTVRVGDPPPLNLPASPLIASYIAGCASGATTAPATADGNSAAPTANAAAAAGD